MFENMLRGLMPPQQQGAFTPEQMDEFRRQAGMLPAAPSGDFFQVPANSPDRQAGQLLPLKGGQPIPDMAPIMGEADGRLGLRGSKNVEIPRASTEGISPLLMDVAPPPAVTKGVMPDGPGPISPKSSFTTLTSLAGAPIQFRSDDSPLNLGDSRTSDWLQRSGRQFDPNGREISTEAGRQAMSAYTAANPTSPPDPTGGTAAPPDNSPEAIVRRAMAFREAFRNENGLNGGHLAITPAGQRDPYGDQAMKMFLDVQNQQMAAGAREKLLGLENQGRMDVAGLQSRSHQFGELDKSELHIRDAVGKGLLDKQTGQAMIDTINARRGNIGSGPGGGAGVAAPGQVGGAGGSTMSPPISAGADVNNLRSLFGQVGPTGQFAANPAAATGQTFSQLIDKIDPSMSPQVVAAIRSGQFGDPASIKNAAYNSLAQNYMMSQGQMAGGQTAAADLVNGGRGGQIPGRYTIPYGPNNKPLLDLVASPPSNVVDSMKKKAGFAQSGVPYDMIRLPDGSQIPFDQSGVQGISNMSSTLGYNQGSRSAAQQRLSKLAQLVDMLQSTQPPR